MFRKAINAIVMLTLLFFTAAALFFVLKTSQFRIEESVEFVNAEKPVSSHEYRSRQQNPSVENPAAAFPDVSPQISQLLDYPPEPSLKEPSLNSRFDIAGSVRDTFGNPVQFAVIQLSSVRANVQFTTQSTVDGDFSLEQLLPAIDYQLNIKSEPRYVTFDAFNLALRNPVDTWNITLGYASHSSLQGVIVDSLGNPVSGLSFLAVSEEWTGNTAGVSSDQFGRFELINFIPGRITLRTVSEPMIIVHGLALVTDETNYCELIVDVGSQQLFGMVTRSDGVPIADVDIRMRFVKRHEDGYRSTTIRSAVTGDSGEFHFSSLGTGHRTLTFSADGFDRHEIDLDPSLNPGPHAIVLSSSASSLAY
jgi:hypothetical protein